MNDLAAVDAYLAAATAAQQSVARLLAALVPLHAETPLASRVALVGPHELLRRAVDQALRGEILTETEK